VNVHASFTKPAKADCLVEPTESRLWLCSAGINPHAQREHTLLRVFIHSSTLIIQIVVPGVSSGAPKLDSKTICFPSGDQDGAPS